MQHTRTSLIKLNAADPRALLDLHRAYNLAARYWMEFLVWISDRECLVRTPDGEEVRWTREVLRGRLDETLDCVVSDADRHLLQTFRSGYLKQSAPGTAYTKVSAKRPELGEGANSEHREGLLALHDLQERGVLPRPLYEAFPVSLPRRLWIGVFDAVAARFKSWNTWRGIARENKEKHARSIEEYRGEIDFERLSDPNARFQEFLTRVEEGNFKLGHRFVSRWARAQKSLRTGKQARLQWDGLLDLLTGEFRSLWDNDDDRDYISELAGLELATRRHERLRDDAALTLPDPDNSPVWVSYDRNHAKLRHVAGTLQLEVLGESRVEARPVPSRYFDGLSLEEGSIPLVFSYTRRGERITTKLKQPQLRVRNGSLYLAIPHDIGDRFEHGRTVREVFDANTHFSTAADKKGKPSAVFDGFTTIAFDIGLKPVAGYSVFRKGHESDFGYETDAGRFGFVEAGHIGGTTRLYKWIRQWHKRTGALRSLLGFYRRLRHTPPNEEIERRDDAFRQIFEIVKGVDRHGNAKTGADAVPESVDDFWTREPDVLRSWVGEAIYAHKREFKQLKAGRCTGRTHLADDVAWLSAVEDYASLLKSHTYAERLPLEKGERRDESAFGNLTSQIRTLRDDVLKKSAAAIVHKAVAVGAHVVVLEDLSRFRISDAGEKDVNRLLSRWGHRGLLSILEKEGAGGVQAGRLSRYGIRVHTVDPRHSSQVSPLDGEWAARPRIGARKGDVHVLSPLGNAYVIDSDISASMVLQRRYLLRYRDLHHVVAQRSGEDWVFPIGARVHGAILHLVGSKYGVIRDGRTVPVNHRDWDRAWSHRTRRRAKLYRHGDRWIGEDEHFRAQDAIANQVSLVGGRKNQSTFHKFLKERSLPSDTGRETRELRQSGSPTGEFDPLRTGAASSRGTLTGILETEDSTDSTQ